MRLADKMKAKIYFNSLNNSSMVLSYKKMRKKKENLFHCLKTNQQQMSLEAGALQVGGARMRADHGEGGNHGNPASGNHEKGNVTLKQSVKYLHVYQPDT